MTYERTIILLSGPIGSGKTTLAEYMERRYGVCQISTSGVLSTLTGHLPNRGELQRVGLEERFQGGEWIADAVMRSVLGDLNGSTGTVHFRFASLLLRFGPGRHCRVAGPRVGEI